ncbi:hypothetical protein FDECE_618 [Fusarium decemcellulare]|nr:hypothetical protein FDECE_618 [Fusarium decemcellulare]
MSPVHLRLEDKGAPDFAPTVVEIINSVFAQEKSPIEAATAIDSLFTRYEGKPDAFIWWFWDLVHSLARQVPYDSSEQDQLAATIKALQDLPSKTVIFSNEGADDSSVQLWTDLPSFGNTYYEKLGEVDSAASGDEGLKQCRLNLQAYGARVTRLCRLPFEMYAIWALADALEGKMTPIRGAPDEINEDPGAVDEYKIKTAAAWMIHMGHMMCGRDEEVRGATAGPLWKLDKKEGIKLRRKFKGTNGLDPKRWQLWKERFASFRDAEELDSKVRKEAGDAYAAMEKAEQDQKL